MTKSLISSAVVVLLILLVTVLTDASTWLVGLLSGLACLAGAWCAPLFQSGSPYGGTFFGGWQSRWDGPKAVQLLAAGAAVAVSVVLNLFGGGVPAVAGIIVALLVGALIPVPGDPAGGGHGADSEDARPA